MALRWFLATAHLLALGVGLGAVWVRARALTGQVDAAACRRALSADTWWGVAALLWITTGLWRLFGSMEKSTEYYLTNHLFLAKMILLAGILAMEIRPILTLSRWRRQLAGGAVPDLSAAGRVAHLSRAQAVLVVLMVAAATAMARGAGAR